LTVGVASVASQEDGGTFALVVIADPGFVERSEGFHSTSKCLADLLKTFGG